MANRFAEEVLRRIPDSIRSQFTPEFINNLTRNAQALFSPEAQDQLKLMLSQIGGQGVPFYESGMLLLRESLSNAISSVFVLVFFFILAAITFNFFLKEVPLRKQHVITHAEPPNIGKGNRPG